MKLGSSWRPPEWMNPYWAMHTTETPSRDRYKSEKQREKESALQAAFEAGASAIIPYVEAETAQKYGKRIKELQETCAQWERLTTEVKAQTRREVGEWLLGPCPHERYKLRGGCYICCGMLAESLMRGEMPGKEGVNGRVSD